MPEPYRRFFGAPLRFDAEQSAVAFPTRWLDHPIMSADRLLHRRSRDAVSPSPSDTKRADRGSGD
ncbi:MAG: AraC family transcriptional regulator [Thiocapsa sp.]|nr:AraC family transcriptional regulator [Thiocapsa sp.]MCG6984709.1 AraC family transcriptional regulator [Thiocapsa sp.]